MINRFKYFMLRQIKGNAFIYSLLILLILVGICIGAFWVGVLSVETKNMLKTYIDNFFILIPAYPLDNGLIFRTSLRNNIIPIILLFLISMTYLGLILVPLYITFRGFCLGFSIAFLTESFGKKGFLFTLIALLPQNIIYIPAIIFACFISLEFCLNILRMKKERFYESRNKYLLSYLTHNSIAIILLIIASVTEAYITPIFIKTITPYFTNL